MQIRRMGVGLAMLTVGYLACALALDRYGRREPPARTYDAIVVLGCRVRPDGTPSLALARRARHGAELFREGRAPLLVTTGGVGDFAPSEARAAADVALAEGVPAEAIVLEERSTSTEENAAEAARVLRERDPDFGGRVLLVSDAYHAFRARRVFARHFRDVDAVGSVGSRSVRARGALREVFAVAAYGALGRL